MSSLPRFFVPADAIDRRHETAVLPVGATHHARSVLRLRAGDLLVLHDGTGFAYQAVLQEGGGKTATVQIVSREPLLTEPRTRITVAQSLPKTSDKVEQVLQHGTEIGAASFIFFQSERSVARMEGRDKIEKRLERWSEIVQSAAEQSRRAVLPSVRWESWLKGLLPTLGSYDQTLVLHESATTTLRGALASAADAQNLIIFVGPEGGFTDAEIAALAGAKAMPVTLGPRILRTETAALATLAQILYEREP